MHSTLCVQWLALMALGKSTTGVYPRIQEDSRLLLAPHNAPLECAVRTTGGPLPVVVRCLYSMCGYRILLAAHRHQALVRTPVRSPVPCSRDTLKCTCTTCGGVFPTPTGVFPVSHTTQAPAGSHCYVTTHSGSMRQARTSARAPHGP